MKCPAGMTLVTTASQCLGALALLLLQLPGWGLRWRLACSDTSWLIGYSKTIIYVLLRQVQQINFTGALDLTNTYYRAVCQAGVPTWVWHSTPSLCNQVSCISSGQEELGAVVTAENNLHSSLLWLSVLTVMFKTQSWCLSWNLGPQFWADQNFCGCCLALKFAEGNVLGLIIIRFSGWSVCKWKIDDSQGGEMCISLSHKPPVIICDLAFCLSWNTGVAFADNSLWIVVI